MRAQNSSGHKNSNPRLSHQFWTTKDAHQNLKIHFIAIYQLKTPGGFAKRSRSWDSEVEKESRLQYAATIQDIQFCDTPISGKTIRHP